MTPVLYRLPEVVSADQVFVVEGEKDSDRLGGLGLTVTTNVGGAGKWRTEYSDSLKNKDVVILPDNDEPGRKHAAQVARSLSGKAKSIKVVELPGLPPKGDVSDWLDAGGTLDQLIDLVEATVPKEPKGGFALTDLGNAERLVRRHGQNIRYNYDSGKWLFWDGIRWTEAVKGEIQQFAKETIRAIPEEAGTTDDDHRKAILKHALRSESDVRLQAMIKLAQSEVPLEQGELDRNEWILNTLSGSIDLRTGKLKPHNRSDFISKLAPVGYDPDAQYPVWTSFLNEIFDRNAELITFVQRAVGYSLTGDTSEQCLFILYGSGANGKSTFIETVRALLGDYARQADSSAFLVRRNDTATNDLARLSGARFVSASETGVGRSFNEVIIKQLTGGEPITARFLYGEFFEFLPVLKIWMATNHKPTIKGTDDGIWRRIRLIPFNVTIPQNRQDPRLIAKLQDELPGILNWALKGCLAWQTERLSEPDAVANSTADYRQEQDQLGPFFDDCCAFDESSEVMTADLWTAYKTWCESSGEKPVNTKTMAAGLRSRGCQSGRDSNGRLWKGLALKKQGP